MESIDLGPAPGFPEPSDRTLAHRAARTQVGLDRRLRRCRWRCHSSALLLGSSHVITEVRCDLGLPPRLTRRPTERTRHSVAVLASFRVPAHTSTTLEATSLPALSREGLVLRLYVPL